MTAAFCKRSWKNLKRQDSQYRKEKNRFTVPRVFALCVKLSRLASGRKMFWRMD